MWTIGFRSGAAEVSQVLVQQQYVLKEERIGWSECSKILCFFPIANFMGPKLWKNGPGSTRHNQRVQTLLVKQTFLWVFSIFGSKNKSAVIKHGQTIQNKLIAASILNNKQLCSPVEHTFGYLQSCSVLDRHTKNNGVHILKYL